MRRIKPDELRQAQRLARSENMRADEEMLDEYDNRVAQDGEDEQPIDLLERLDHNREDFEEAEAHGDV